MRRDNDAAFHRINETVSSNVASTSLNRLLASSRLQLFHSCGPSSGRLQLATSNITLPRTTRIEIALQRFLDWLGILSTPYQEMRVHTASACSSNTVVAYFATTP